MKILFCLAAMLALVNAGLLDGAYNVPSLSYLPPSRVPNPAPPVDINNGLPSERKPTVYCPGYEHVVNPTYLPPRCLPNRNQIGGDLSKLPTNPGVTFADPGYNYDHNDHGGDSTNDGN